MKKKVCVALYCSSQIEYNLFEKEFFEEMEKENISLNSIEKIGSIYLKKNEHAFLKLSEKLTIPYITFSEEEILTKKHQTSSSFLYNRIGVYNVVESVAQLLSDSENYTIEKEITVPSYKVFSYSIGDFIDY